jgi:uncharacterized membrane protein YqgA involved in biofilm formation
VLRKRQPHYQKTKEIKPSQKALFANNIDETIALILDILHESGMERERLALAAGAEIAKQMRPFSLVVLALVAGFVIGRILKRGNPPRV